jgi:hypothetical protein
MLSVKTKPLPPISVVERAPATRPETGQPFPTMPEEMPVEEGEAEEIDPTGIQGILKDITQSIPADARYTSLVQPEASGVQQILSERT